MIEQIIQRKYKDVYDSFRMTFGLKFNYSVRLMKDKESEIEKIQLIKRCNKGWFKDAKYLSLDKHETLSNKLLN